MTANRLDKTRADIHARGFWGRHQGAFFDVRVFHPNAPSYHSLSIQSLYRHYEQEKKMEYGDHVWEIEQASFTPLVFATTEGMGRERPFLSQTADLLSHRNNVTYNTTLAEMHTVCHFLCCDLPQCAFVAVGSSLIDHLIVLLRWA